MLQGLLLEPIARLGALLDAALVNLQQKLLQSLLHSHANVLYSALLVMNRHSMYVYTEIKRVTCCH
jgi:hypothetical protein